MDVKARNNAMKVIKTLNLVERTLRGLAFLFPGLGKLADDVAGANRLVATERTRYKTAAPAPAARPARHY